MILSDTLISHRIFKHSKWWRHKFGHT